MWSWTIQLILVKNTALLLAIYVYDQTWHILNVIHISKKKKILCKDYTRLSKPNTSLDYKTFAFGFDVLFNILVLNKLGTFTESKLLQDISSL